MKNFLRKPKEKFLKFADLESDTLIYRALPNLFLELLTKYFRTDVVGLENIPRRGKVIIAPNHSGYAGFDALILAHLIYKNSKRIPRILMHKLWFVNSDLTHLAHKFGFAEANYANGVQALKKNNMIMLFPEGEHGNFKPTSRMYQLQEFKRGFIRMAIETNSPIVPTLIIGAEEAHINLKKWKLFGKVVLPLPLNIVPLPVKWRVVFLDPITLPYQADSIDDSELMNEIAQEIQEKMQDRLALELKARGSAFFSKK